MGALLEPHEPRSSDAPVDGLGDVRRHLVIAADSDEGGKTDFGQLVRHVPITDRADNCELVRPIHRVIYWFGEMVEAVDDLAGPHGKAAHVPPIELVDSSEELGMLVVLGRLTLPERRLRLPLHM